jgi:hypothetical protein
LLAALLVEATAPPVCGSPVNWIQKKQGGLIINLTFIIFHGTNNKHNYINKPRHLVEVQARLKLE